MVSVLLAGQSMVSGVSVKLNICIYMAYFGYKAEGQSTYMQLYAAIHDKLIFALLYFQHTSRKWRSNIEQHPVPLHQHKMKALQHAEQRTVEVYLFSFQ